MQQHGGNAHCWCSEKPPADGKADKKVTPQQLTNAARGCVKSACQWKVCWSRHTVTVTGCEVDHSVFHNLLNQVKHSMGVPVLSCGEFKLLLAWLEEEQDAQRAYARYDTTEDREVCRVMYMARDMRYNFERNGQVLIMDTTHKTNRFGWPLLLVCGINEHFNTVILAVALFSHSTTESFEWVFGKMKGAVSERAWQDVRSVATDGEAAMEAAMRALYHRRVVYAAGITSSRTYAAISSPTCPHASTTSC